MCVCVCVGETAGDCDRVFLSKVSGSRMTGPSHGDKILILKEPWLGLLLRGEKTLEIRGAPYASGRYWLGCKKVIHGEAIFAHPRLILSDDEWEELRPLHRIEGPRPYNKTFGLKVLSVSAAKMTHYSHPRGAVTIVRFRRG